MAKSGFDSEIVDPDQAFERDIQPLALTPVEKDASSRAAGRVEIESESPGAQDAADAPPARLVSLDALRGLVMILMVSAGLQIGKVVKSFDASPELSKLKTPTWVELAHQTDHGDWRGFTLWDFIQPGFMFMVGTALAFSLASRRAKGQSFGRMLFHAIFRSILLIWLGIFLGNNSPPRTDWSFVNVLTQIGLGYTFLFLIAWLKPRWQFAVGMVIVAGYWGAFALYPAPAKDFDLAIRNLPADWKRLDGFNSHWEKNMNLGTAVDKWFLNLFPRNPVTPPPRFDEQQFGKTAARTLERWASFLEPRGPVTSADYNGGGYVTLNFVPSLATMIFGLLAGEWVRRRGSAGAKFGVLLLAGAVGIAAGLALDYFGLCPIIKRIWTPSWTLFSAGVVLASLAIFYLIIDVARLKFWAYPLMVVGANSIVIYAMSMSLKGWFHGSMRRHFGQEVYELGGHLKLYAPIVEASFFLLFCWLVCWWMYRRKIYVKI